MGFSRQECWSQLPFPSPGDLPDPGIELRSPALQADASPSEPEGLTQNTRAVKQKIMTARDPKALSERSSWDHLRLRTQVYWLPAAAVTKNCKLGCLKQQKVWKPEVQNQGANGPGPLQRLWRRRLPCFFHFYWLPALLVCGHITPVSASVVTLLPPLLSAPSSLLPLIRTLALAFRAYADCFCCSVAKFCPTLFNTMDCSMQSSLSLAICQSLLKLKSTESVMPSNHLILCCPLLLLPSISPSTRVFSSELALPIRWPKYCSFSISPFNECSVLISFRIDWFDLLAVQGTQESSLASQFKSINSLVLSLLSAPTLTSIHEYWKNHSFD